LPKSSRRSETGTGGGQVSSSNDSVHVRILNQGEKGMRIGRNGKGETKKKKKGWK